MYVPHNYYEEIVEKLKQLGVSDSHYTKYTGKNKIAKEIFERDYNRAMEELDEHRESMKDKILFWGWNFAQKNDYRSFFERMQNKNPSISYGVVGENIWMTQEEAENLHNAPTVITPAIFDKDIFLESGISSNELKLLPYEEKINNAIARYVAFFPNATCDEAKTDVFFCLKYVEEVLTQLEPRMMVVVGSRMVRSEIIAYACEKRGVKHVYTHAGFIPGTYLFDSKGELGLCVPNLKPDKFRNLPVSDEEVNNAKNVLRELYKNGTNRKVQPQNDCIDIIKREMIPDRPIVFFAAQPETDFIPYTDEIRDWYTPNFESSAEAGIFISKLCRENNWNFVYKPHPMYIDINVKQKLERGSIYIETGNINDLIDIADVVVTVQSSVNYVSLIREKPVVMLGYNQTREKGCTYEAFDKSTIENVLRISIKEGYTAEQKEAFYRHIAQCLKYYLYDDLSNKTMQYGMDVPVCMEDFFRLEEMMED